MSLENQVAELVTSAKKLVNEIAGKMKGIDQKVDKTAVDILDKLSGSREFEFYVDGEAGNDNNSGNSNAPFRTLRKALSICPAGSTATILLKGGKSYEIPDGSRCAAGRLTIYGMSRNAQETNLYIDDSTPVISLTGRFDFYGASIQFGSYRQSVVLNLLHSANIQFFSIAVFSIYGVKLTINKSGSNDPALGAGNDTRTPAKISLQSCEIDVISNYLASGPVLLTTQNIKGISRASEIISEASERTVLSSIPI